MKLVGEQKINATRDVVYAALNDTEILKNAIPGCEEIIKISDTEMTAIVALKVGPVKAKFKGAVQLSNLNPPVGYTISGEGNGGPAGSARGGADVTLLEDGGSTILQYDVSADVRGKFAQLGSRLIDSTAKKLAGQFFEKFAAIVETGPAPAEKTGITGATDPAPKAAVFTKPVLWIASAIFIAAIIFSSFV